MKTASQETLCIRISRVAEMLDCSESKVYSLIQEGHLDTIKLSEGKKSGKRVLSSSLNQFLRRGGVVHAKELSSADRVNAQQFNNRRSSRKWYE